jgi:hypothetical protein
MEFEDENLPEKNFSAEIWFHQIDSWCRMSSSMALPRLEAVSPIGSELRRRRIAGR